MPIKTIVNKFVVLAIVLLISGIGLVIASVVLYGREEIGLAMTVFFVGVLDFIIGLVVGDAAGKVVMSDDVVSSRESTSASKQVL